MWNIFLFFHRLPLLFNLITTTTTSSYFELLRTTPWNVNVDLHDNTLHILSLSFFCCLVLFQIHLNYKYLFKFVQSSFLLWAQICYRCAWIVGHLKNYVLDWWCIDYIMVYWLFLYVSFELMIGSSYWS